MTEQSGQGRLVRGDVWWSLLDPTVGHEQGGRRPCIIVSTDDFNRLDVGIVIVVPLTTSDHGYPTHHSLQPGTGGLSRPSFAMTEQIRAVSTERLLHRIGQMDTSTMRELTYQLLVMLDV